jgi:GH43 family beta-xylosidase
MNTISTGGSITRGLGRAILVLLALGALASFSPKTAAQAPTFRNPLNNSGPDPWMTYYNGNYYYAATTWGGASTGLTMRRASTIAGIKTATPVRIWQDSTASRCCNYWAPEFHLINGPNGLRWYGYYTGGASGTNYTVTQHVHVIESAGTDPMGPYTYRGQLVSRAALDASVVTINGTMYAIYSVWNATQDVAIKQMSNPWTTVGSEVVIAAPTLSWERQEGNVAEGPVALQRNGRTFIIYSASACWGPNYKLGMLTLTGTNPLSASAWTKSPNPVFQRSDANGVFGPGHNNFFKSPDGTQDWIIYHANNSAGGGCDMNRTPRIQRFTWNADGSPNFGIPVSTNTDLSVPSGEGGGPTPTATRTPTRTSTAIGPTPTRTPTPPPGGQVLQAEAASFGGGATADSNNAGFNGTGFINFPASGGFLQFNNVNGGTGGSRTLRIRYALGVSTSRTGQLTVNGASQNITFTTTGAWTSWAIHNVTVSLNAGTGNTVRFQSNGQDLANIDQLEAP